ncbi:hypothetical protein JKF63_00294 [Porcisia hertigi]|uniref:PHF5-like protein n=1 Tax=Porcisia hertigi TaxID=2761500 RepID=A0A836L0Y2_9TRYP|nr:hypothetical protein JKF63_00294 [Porcisia hertigi]
MLRHSRDLQMCRKTAGIALGYVCRLHEGRCVICDMQFDEIVDTMREAHLCEDCSVMAAEGEEACIMCGSRRVTDMAYYCTCCVALEKDRDGCPRVLNQTRQQRLAALRAAVSQ